MVINYVNPEHTHALIDLPTAYSVEDVTKLPKGAASSHWINKNRIIGSRFRWGRTARWLSAVEQTRTRGSRWQHRESGEAGGLTRFDL